MALALKEFKVPMTSLVGEVVQNAPAESPTNMLTLQMFYDDAWDEQPRNVIFWFDGGSGDGIENLTYARPNYVVQNGYIYCNCSAFKANLHPMKFDLAAKMPIHDFTRYAFEVESFISYFYESLITDVLAHKYLDINSKICLTGTSRGAGNILQWSCLSGGIYTAYKDNVVGIVANSPAGGGTTQDWQGPYIGQRATYKFYQNVNHKTVGCMGAGDLTHTNRAHIERVYAAITNPKVRLTAEGNNSWGHTWPGNSDKFQILFNYAFNMFV